MRKLLALLTFLLCCSFAVTNLAAAEQTTAPETETAAEAVNAAEGAIPSETITVDEMQERLKTSSSEDILYVKIKDERVEVYKGFTADRSLRKQFILNAPATEMLRLYTTNKATFEQMNKMLSDYERSNVNFNGYRIITDKDAPRKLENGGKIYRLWFMKIEREKQSRRGWNFPIGIGIGIGHHRHGGPWIGVGI